MSDPTAIRAAAPGEAAALTDLVLRSKAMWGYDDAFMAAAAPELAVTEAAIAHRPVLVGERDGRLLGVAGVDPAVDPPELDLLFVAPEARGTGLGRALLHAALALAHEAGIDELAIVSDPNAEPFYLAQGAVRTGGRPSESTGRTLPLLTIRTAPRG